jgi:hypothetical protein
MKRFVTLAATVIVVVSVAAQVAMAGSTVLGAYGSNAAKPVLKAKGAVASHVKGAVVSAQGAKTLPFTGSDLAVVSIAGIALLGLGFGLRRLGRDRS